jgi:hypothetical protein
MGAQGDCAGQQAAWMVLRPGVCQASLPGVVLLLSPRHAVLQCCWAVKYGLHVSGELLGDHLHQLPA